MQVSTPATSSRHSPAVTTWNITQSSIGGRSSAPRRRELRQAIERAAHAQEVQRLAERIGRCFPGFGHGTSMRSAGHGVHGPGRKSMKHGPTAIVAPERRVDSGRQWITANSRGDRHDREDDTGAGWNGQDGTPHRRATGGSQRAGEGWLALGAAVVRLGETAPRGRPRSPDVDAVYISYYPDLAAPGATDAIRAFTDLAVRSGVRRLVLLSGRGEPEAQRCEEIVKRPARSGRCFAAAGSTRTSARTTCSSRFSPARSRCRRRTSASRSSMPTT